MYFRTTMYTELFPGRTSRHKLIAKGLQCLLSHFCLLFELLRFLPQDPIFHQSQVVIGREIRHFFINVCEQLSVDSGNIPGYRRVCSNKQTPWQFANACESGRPPTGSFFISASCISTLNAALGHGHFFCVVDCRPPTMDGRL
jgi:hypothetical protein